MLHRSSGEKWNVLVGLKEMRLQWSSVRAADLPEPRFSPEIRDGLSRARELIWRRRVPFLGFLIVPSRSTTVVRIAHVYWPQFMSEPRVLRVFVASPDDVAEERNALAKL